MAVPEKIRDWDGRKLRKISHYKVVNEGTNKYAVAMVIQGRRGRQPRLS